MGTTPAPRTEGLGRPLGARLRRASLRLSSPRRRLGPDPVGERLSRRSERPRTPRKRPARSRPPVEVPSQRAPLSKRLVFQQFSRPTARKFRENFAGNFSLL